MQIDLFRSRRRNQDSAKLGGYVKHRKFELDKNVDFGQIRKLTTCTNSTVIDEYISKLEQMATKERKYDDIGYGIGSDNLYELEALGVGKYAKKYQVILSFEDKLDYLLHVVSGCKVDSVRNIPHYAEISSAFVALKTISATSDATFSHLYNIDPKLDEYFMKISKQLREKDTYRDEELVEKLAYEIEMPILRTIESMQNYIIAFMSAARSGAVGMVCRSRDYASLIFTSEYPVTDDFILTYDDYDEVSITPRCYERYEYAAKEVLVCDSCRRC